MADHDNERRREADRRYAEEQAREQERQREQEKQRHHNEMNGMPTSGPNPPYNAPVNWGGY